MARSLGQLTIQLEGQVTQTLPLNMSVLTLGRTPDNGLMLPNQQVSRNHAELRIEPQGLLLTDLGSSNGTFIGDQRILPHQPQLLTHGNSFRIGPYLLTYYAASQATAPADPAETQEPAPQPEPPALKKKGREEQTARMAPEPALPAAPTQKVPRVAPQALRSPFDSTNGIYQRFLPDIYQENDFLRRFLMLFEDIWEPLEQRQDHIEMYFDPRTCPPSFLAWLAGWLDLSLNEHWPVARRRRLLAQATELYRWRGTQHGLIRMIEVCTGLTPIIQESSSQPFVFHIRVTLRPGPDGETIDKALIEDLIQMHKPAHAGYLLEVNT